ncbi:hypothetical protein [Gordonia insulae]|uniref:Uncharacterized protein n=1 Tax=Gordonia insulae TaxID=2420509 RepID=A0A3G8JGU8_9ACTN|nr:hypothetical protein [Gordonia insulae]AZG43480.1 hypothetical protein D7316_00045 [Gordonia insulae]
MSKHYRPRYRIERCDTDRHSLTTSDVVTEQGWWVSEITDPDSDPHGPFPTHDDALAFALCKAGKASRIREVA